MSTGNKNPYPKTVSVATAHILSYERTKQKNAKKKQRTKNDNGSDTDEQEEGKTLLAVGKSLRMFKVKGIIMSNGMMIVSLTKMR